jgi:hypothetical protein
MKHRTYVKRACIVALCAAAAACSVGDADGPWDAPWRNQPPPPPPPPTEEDWKRLEKFFYEHERWINEGGDTIALPEDGAEYLPLDPTTLEPASRMASSALGLRPLR